MKKSFTLLLLLLFLPISGSSDARAVDWARKLFQAQMAPHQLKTSHAYFEKMAIPARTQDMRPFWMLKQFSRYELAVLGIIDETHLIHWQRPLVVISQGPRAYVVYATGLAFHVGSRINRQEVVTAIEAGYMEVVHDISKRRRHITFLDPHLTPRVVGSSGLTIWHTGTNGESHKP